MWFNRLVASLVVLCVGCSTSIPLEQTQLETRQFQTRSFIDTDLQTGLRAVVSALQDLGFIIKQATPELGIVTATKEMDVGSTGEAVGTTVLFGVTAAATFGLSWLFWQRPSWKKNAVLESSSNVSESSKELRIRTNFQWKVMNNRGEVIEIKQVDDAAFYQNFFSKVDKSIFIQKEKI